MTKEIKSLYQLTKKLGDMIPERIQAVITWLFFFCTSLLFIGAIWVLLVLADAAGAVM